MIIIPFRSKLDMLMLDEVREQEFFGSIQVNPTLAVLVYRRSVSPLVDRGLCGH